jgi:hypothetical protein
MIKAIPGIKAVISFTCCNMILFAASMPRQAFLIKTYGILTSRYIMQLFVEAGEAVAVPASSSLSLFLGNHAIIKT